MDEISVVKDYLTTASDGKQYSTNYYNLDVVISVGYRVKSHRGTQFRIWATKQLREYIVKGFVLNDEKLKETGHTNQYFDELFERIRDIRSSEKIFYAKIRDIYTNAQRHKVATNCSRLKLLASDGKMRLTDVADTK